MLENEQQTPAPETNLEPTADFAQEQAPQAPLEEPAVPDKYKGKGLADIIEMHRNAESELGRARNEVGQVRRLADELLGIHRASPASAPAKPVERKKLTPEDLLNDPESSVVAVVQATVAEREKELRDGQARLETEFAMQRFERKHPDYQKTMVDPKFTDWVQKSQLRLGLAQAAYHGNVQAADELFTLFTESTPVAASEPREPVNQVEQARKASLARPGGGSVTGGGRPNDAGKKIWKRTELLDMRMNNPEEFDRLQPEILKAYAEKRVR